MPSSSLPHRPYFEAHLFVCCNRRPEGHPRGSCAALGSEKLRDYLKVRVKETGLPHRRVNMAGCLDRCEEGPCLVVYPDGVWYRAATREDIDRIVQEHLVEGRPVAALRLPDREADPAEDLAADEQGPGAAG